MLRRMFPKSEKMLIDKLGTVRIKACAIRMYHRYGMYLDIKNLPLMTASSGVHSES
jgi:hypothetical protein